MELVVFLAYLRSLGLADLPQFLQQTYLAQFHFAPWAGTKLKALIWDS
jgi:hypothetical protein